jgi:hypothetical protein
MKEVGYLKKDKVLEGGARYPYLSEEQVTAETHAVFAKVGIAMMPIAVEILENRLDHTMKGGELHNTRIRTTFRLIDAEDASFMDIQTLGEGSDSGDKTLNKCMTAAYKYAIRQTLMISTGDDPDAVPSNETKGTARPPAQAAKPAPPKPSEPLAWHQQQAKKLRYANLQAWCLERGVDYEGLLADREAQKSVHDILISEVAAMNTPFDTKQEAK